jgi:hypothetical protein
MDRHFREVIHGEKYDIAYVDSSGVLLPGTGPRTRGVAND